MALGLKMFVLVVFLVFENRTR